MCTTLEVLCDKLLGAVCVVLCDKLLEVLCDKLCGATLEVLCDKLCGATCREVLRDKLRSYAVQSNEGTL